MKRLYHGALALEKQVIPTLQHIIAGIKLLFIVSAGWYICVFLVLASYNLFYDDYLGWFEDMGFDVLKRLSVGQHIYAEPSEQYVPFIYPPAYYHLSSLVSQIFGINFFSLRLVSFFSTIGSLIIIYRFVYTETKTKKVAFIAAGIYASTYTLTDGVMVFGRLDSFHTFLLLSMLYQIRTAKVALHHLFASGLAVLAYFTKQTTVIIVIMIGIYYLLAIRKYIWLFVLPFLIISATMIWYLNTTTDGWFGYYTLFLPTRHTLNYQNIMYFITRDIFFFMGGLTVIIATYFLRKKNLFFLCAFIGMGAISFVGKANTGGSFNVLLPIYAIFAICGGIALHEVFKQASHTSRLSVLFAIVFVLGICSIQIHYGYIDYLEAIPTRQDKENTKRFITALKKIKGDIYIPSHTYYLRLAQKNSHAHMDWLHELTGYWGNRIPTKEGAVLEKKLTDKIARKQFGAIVLSGSQVIPKPNRLWLNPYLPLIKNHYNATKTYPVKIQFADITFTVYLPKS